jgi:hypothetical protein
MACGTPAIESMREYSPAAISRNRMAAETRPVSFRTRQKRRQPSCCRSRAMTSAPAAPTAPASVGVKKPV